MDKEPSKPWEKPWTTDEIRDHSPNWNLAGDSGLLNHLQQFSQNLLAQTHATEVALDKLLEDLKTTSTNVQNATNNFLFLANTQFVENRVYDDDEKETPPEEKKDSTKLSKTKEEQEAEVFQNVKQALDMGLALLDTHFEAVEVPASDSEEEESSASVGRLVLKPKNPYFSRPLPYLIGSREFMEDDRVGLGDMSSDTEGSPDQNVVQSSESDDEMEHDELLVPTKRPMTLSSSETENSEPESDRSGTVAKQKKLRTGSSIRTLEGEEDEGEMFGQESSPEADESVVKGNLKSALSDELASKLSSASSHHLPERGKEDVIFVPSSEPEDDSGLFGKANRSFTEKQGLFDDLDDWQGTSSSLWRNNNSSNKPIADSTTEQVGKTGSSTNGNKQEDDMQQTTKTNMNTTANVVDDKKICTSTPEGVTSKLRETGLFSPKNDTEDLFTIKHKDTSAATSSSLFGNDDLQEDDLFAAPSQPSTAQTTKKKILPGAVPVFSDVNLFGDLSPVVHHDSTAENGTSKNNMQSIASSLQQESSSGVGNTLYSISKKENENMSQDVMSGNEKSSLFDSRSDELFKNAATSTKIHESVPSKSSLFKEENESDSLFDKPHYSDQTVSILNRNISGNKVSSSLKPKTKKPVSLFDDSDSGDDELLFSSTSSTSSRSRRSQGSADILAGISEKKTLPKKGLFEDNILFGAGNKDDPDVDIFSSTSDLKPKSGFLSKDNVFDGDGITGDTSGGTKKITSSIFDNIDDVDDIFAIPKMTVEKLHGHSDSSVMNNTVKSSLFSDDTASKISIKFQDKKQTEEPHSVPKEIHNNDVSGVPSVIDISTRLISANSSLQENKNSIQNTSNEKVTKNAKPTVSQKPKVPMKPAPSSSTAQESAQVANNPRVENKEDRSQQCKNKDILTVSASADSDQLNSTLEVQKVSDNQISSVSHVKPEPPRTLNIRKTTDILFESPSNEDDDLFVSSQSEKSMGNESVSQISNNNNNINNTFSSSNFSKLLEGFSYPTPSRNEPKVDSSNYSSISKTHFISEASDVHPAGKPISQQISSPSKLFIDPRALLPGAKPPSTMVAADRAVDFDKPAETTSMLHSAGKERVKIQVKRRPQTRRARQEALRASSLEYDTIDAALISQITNNNNNSVHTVSLSASSSSLVSGITPKIFEPDNVKKSLLVEKSENDDRENSSRNNSEGQSSISESDHLALKADAYKLTLSDGLSGNSNPLSPLTDEEDLFAVPHDLPFDETSNKEVSNDSKNIFGGAPVLSPLDLRIEENDYNTQSLLLGDEKKDNFMSSKRDTGTHSTLGDTLENDHVLQKDASISDLSNSLVTSNKTDCDNKLSVSKREDEFTEPSDSKWLESGHLESAIKRRGLFDDCDDLDKVDDKDDDDDLFSTTKFGQKGKTRTVHRNVSPTTLFSPVATSDFENVVTAGLHVNQSPSSSTNPSQSKILTLTGSDAKPDLLYVASTNISDEQKSSSENSSLFPERRSDSSQRNEMGGLFTSNISAKESTSSVKVKVKSNAQQERVKSHIDTLFGDDSTESDDLFGSSSVPKKPIAGSDSNYALCAKLREAKESIFDDGDDDDIFTIGLSKNKGPKSEALFPKHENSMPSAEESDDLFSKKNGNGGNKGTKSSSVQKVQSFEDPLMVFNK